MNRSLVSVVSLVSWCVTAVAMHQTAQAEEPAALNVPPAKAYRLVLEKFTPRKHDMVLTVFVRDGQAAHAYAQTPSVDQTLHRVDVTPAAPIEYLLEGQRFDPPENLKGDYDYKNEDFLKYRVLHAEGKLVMRNYDPPAPLALTDAAGTGVFDLFLDAPDDLKRDRFRIRIDLKKAGDRLVGRYQAHDYHARDQHFRPRQGSFEGVASAREMPEHWQHTPDRAFAKGLDWPQQHGPMLNGSAIDSQREFIDNIADARLLWVADMPVPGGRGGIPRSPFGFFPINNSGLGITQYSAPIVVGGRVYLAVPYVDQSDLEAAPGLKDNPRIIRGVDPRALAADLGVLRDTLFCIDAQTGRTLWMFQDPRKSGLLGASKSGRGLTAAYHSGKIIFRGQASLYAVDALTGRLLWQNNGQKAVKGGDPGYSFGATQTWSTDHSPVIIDGVIVVRMNDSPKAEKNASPGQPAEYTTLMGFDPETGKLLWRASQVTGRNAIATSIALAGKTYIIAAYEGATNPLSIAPESARPEHRGLLSLIEPATGRIVWQKPVVGPTSSYPLVWEDIIALNVERERTSKDNKDKPVLVPSLGAVRVGLDHAEVIWNHPKVDWQDGRQTPIAHRGAFIQDSRISGFQAFDARTGAVLGTFPHLYRMAYGSHNWTWAIASNGRIFTSGQFLLMFRLQEGKMELMPGALPVDLASGYVCPIRPAIADGRLFVRTGDGLACYDLRKPAAAQKVDAITLTATDLALGMSGKGDVDLQVRLVNGQPEDLVVRYPAFQDTGTPRPYAWGGLNAMRWRSGGIPTLHAEGARIHGQTMVRVNEHLEPWILDLTLSGGTASGTCERTVPPARTPIDVKGDIAGEVETLANGIRRYNLRLASGGINGRGEPADLNVYIELSPDGTRRAYAAAGRINQASFEADPSRLEIDDTHLRGPLAIIVHNDRYISIHPNSSTSLAITCQLDGVIGAESTGQPAITGSFNGVVGAAYRKTVPVTGRLHRNADLQVAVEAGESGQPTPDDAND